MGASVVALCVLLCPRWAAGGLSMKTGSVLPFDSYRYTKLQLQFDSYFKSLQMAYPSALNL